MDRVESYLNFLNTIKATRHDKPQSAEMSLEVLTAVLLDIGYSLAVIADEINRKENE